jgi:hypothetical protein
MSIVDIIEKINYNKLKNAIKDRQDTGYNVSYLIMSEDTYVLFRRDNNDAKTINCVNNTWYFYGIPIAICNSLSAGKVELVNEI